MTSSLIMRCCAVLLFVFNYYYTPLAGAPSQHLAIGVEGHTPTLMVTSAEIGIGIEVTPKNATPTTTITLQQKDKSSNHQRSKSKLSTTKNLSIVSPSNTKSNQWLNTESGLRTDGLKSNRQLLKTVDKSFFNQDSKTKYNNSENAFLRQDSAQGYKTLTLDRENNCLENLSAPWCAKINTKKSMATKFYEQISNESIENPANIQKMIPIFTREFPENTREDIDSQHNDDGGGKRNHITTTDDVNDPNYFELKLFPRKVTSATATTISTSETVWLPDKKQLRKNRNLLADHRNFEIRTDQREKKQDIENVANIYNSKGESSTTDKSTTVTMPSSTTIDAITVVDPSSTATEIKCNYKQCNGAKEITTIAPVQRTQLNTTETLLELIDLEPFNKANGALNRTLLPTTGQQKNEMAEIEQQEHDSGHDGRKITKKKQLIDKHYHFLMHNESEEVLATDREERANTRNANISDVAANETIVKIHKLNLVGTTAEPELSRDDARKTNTTINHHPIESTGGDPESKISATISRFNHYQPHLGPILMAEKTFHVTPVKSNSHTTHHHHTSTIESQLRDGLITEIKPSGVKVNQSALAAHSIFSVEKRQMTTTATTSTSHQVLPTTTATENDRTESKISDIQIEIYDSKTDDATDLSMSTISSHRPLKYSLDTTQTTTSLYPSLPSSLPLLHHLPLSGGTTKPPIPSMQLERFTQYVIDRIETSTPQSFNVSLVEAVSGKPEPATIEIHINVSESVGHEESTGGIIAAESILSGEGEDDKTENGVDLQEENTIRDNEIINDKDKDNMGHFSADGEASSITNNKQDNEFLYNISNRNNNEDEDEDDDDDDDDDDNNHFGNYHHNQMHESEVMETDADVEVKIPDNLAIGGSVSGYDGIHRPAEQNHHKDDEILVVEIIDPVNTNVSNDKSKDDDLLTENNKAEMHLQPQFNVNSNDELFLANVRENAEMFSESVKSSQKKIPTVVLRTTTSTNTAVSSTAIPSVPLRKSLLNNFDRDSDTIFYISNTEVKVGESLPTKHTSFNSHRKNEQNHKLQLENQFFPVNYKDIGYLALSTVPSIRRDEENSQDFNVQPLHMYEEDIILSPVRNQADSLKIYRNQKDASLMAPLDVAYVGESIIEVEQSPEMTTTINTATAVPSTMATISTVKATITSRRPDVIIQPIDLPADIDMDMTDEDEQSSTSVEEIPPQIELKEFDFMPNEIQRKELQQRHNGQTSDNLAVYQKTSKKGSDYSHNRNNYEQNNQYQENHTNDQRTIETNHLLDSSIQYGGDLIDESADSGFEGVENSYPFANPAEMETRTSSSSVISGFRVHHLQKEQFSADEPQQLMNELDASSSQRNDSFPLSPQSFPSSVTMAMNNSNANRVLTTTNDTLLPVHTTELDKNVLSKDDDFKNLISIVIGLFIILIPLVISIGMFCALRFLYNKYQAGSSSTGGNEKGETSATILSTNHNANIVGELSLTIPEVQTLDSAIPSTIDINASHTIASAASLPTDQSKRLSANAYHVRDLDSIDEYQDPSLYQRSNISECIAVYPKHLPSEKAEDAATVTVSAAPLCISGIRDSAVQLGVQQLKLNPGSQRFLSQITRQSLSTPSQPPLPNGSVTKMTMENNLLTIETEERNDISRMARETRMDYNKDGVFVVEVSRGVDSKSIPGSPVTDDPDRTVSLFESRLDNYLPNNEEVQIHSPPGDNHGDIVRAIQQQIVETVEPIYTSQLAATSSPGLNSTPIAKPSICTGLSQSNTSLASSTDSNKGYSYGNQELYVIENATDGKLTGINVTDLAATNSSNDSQDDDRKSQNGQDTFRTDCNMNNDTLSKADLCLPSKSFSSEDTNTNNNNTSNNNNNNNSREECNLHLETENGNYESKKTHKIAQMMETSCQETSVEKTDNLSAEGGKGELKTSTLVDTLPDLIPDNKTSTIDPVANGVTTMDEIGEFLPDPPTNEELYCKDVNEESIQNGSEWILTTSPPPPPPTPPLPPPPPPPPQSSSSSSHIANGSIANNDDAETEVSSSTTTGIYNGSVLHTPTRNIDLNKNCYQVTDSTTFTLTQNGEWAGVGQTKLATEIVSTSSTSLSSSGQSLDLNGNNGDVISGPLTPPASPPPGDTTAHYKHLYIPTLARVVDVNGS